jgi:hypothetical protein
MTKTINTDAMCAAFIIHEDRTDVEIQFYKLLTERLRGDTNVQGIAVACTLFLYDVRSGVDGFTGQPLHTVLRGLPTIGTIALFVEAKQIILANVPDDVRADVESALKGLS